MTSHAPVAAVHVDNHAVIQRVTDVDVFILWRRAEFAVSFDPACISNMFILVM